MNIINKELNFILNENIETFFNYTMFLFNKCRTSKNFSYTKLKSFILEYFKKFYDF